MRGIWLLCAALAGAVEPVETDLTHELLGVRRVFVDRLGGGETAGHLRDMIISSLLRSRLFVLTENESRADAFLRGSAEDLIFTDTFQTSSGVSGRASFGRGSTERSGGEYDRNTGYASAAVGEQESSRIAERKHEAAAYVRLVNKDGDVIWATTQESLGAKFRGASADVADKIVKQLVADVEKARKKAAQPR